MPVAVRRLDILREPGFEPLAFTHNFHMCYRCDNGPDLILKFLERRASSAQIYVAARKNSLLFRETFYDVLLASISEILGKEPSVPLYAYYVSGTTALPPAQCWEQPALGWELEN
jgi:hypothetical protein